jgi:hypothetical protein
VLRFGEKSVMTLLDVFKSPAFIILASVVSLITFGKYVIAGWKWLHGFAQTKRGHAALNVISCIGIVVILVIVLFKG